MARFFTFKEMTTTQTGLDNTPTWDAIKNLSVLASFLDKIRVSFGKPIRVNCAFRSDAVNEKVGGAKTSAHLKGLAADIAAWSGKEEDNRALLSALEKNMTCVDQLISYHAKPGKNDSPIRFIHVGLCDGFPRMQRFNK